MDADVFPEPRSAAVANGGAGGPPPDTRGEYHRVVCPGDQEISP
jgi:hypothetical protein